MPLDSQWVDRIHSRLLARYGSRWLNMWAAVDPAIVKADWAYFLDGLSADSIAWGLDNLDDEAPPTVGQFRTLCCKRPEMLPALTYERAGQARIEAELRRLAELQASKQRTDPRAWAYELQEREKSGARLTLAQRHAWRRALETAPVLEGGQFSPIPDDSLPPAMRQETA